MEWKSNKQRDNEQTIRNNRRMHIIRRQSKDEELLDIIRELWRITEVIPGPVEENMGQPTLVSIRELVPLPADRSVVTQKPIHQGQDRIEIVVVQAPAIRALGATELLERFTAFLSNTFSLNREMDERPACGVSSGSQTGDQRGVPVRIAETFLKDLEDNGDRNVADTGMPDDVGDKIEDHEDPVRVEGAIEHPDDAKGVRDEPTPVDFLLLENQRNFLT